MDHWSIALGETIHEVKVRGADETVGYAEWFDQMVVLDESRQERLHEAEPLVPALLWVALIGGAAILIGYVTLFANPRIRAAGQLAVIGAIAAVLAVNLCVIYVLDHPYEGGSGGVDPHAMEESLTFMDDERQRLGLDPVLPCDERGAPAGESV